ncbi:MAG: cation-translocating P-type ATPase [Promethearchaeota archaeon]
MSTDEVLRELETSSDGLPQTEAEARLLRYGPNELPKPEKEPVWKKFLRQFTDLIVIVLVVAAVVSAVVGVLEGEGMSDTIVIVIILLLNATIGTYQEVKAEKAVESLQTLEQHQVRTKRDGEEKLVEGKKLVPGDVIFIEAGDTIPADGRILTSMNLKVEEGALTGESVPVEKDSRPLPDPEITLADRHDMVYSGTSVSYGKAEVIVTGTGLHTEIGKIATMLAETEETTTPLAKSLDKVGKQLTQVILVVCAAVFLISILRALDQVQEAVVEALLVAISLAVAAIPEGLPAIVTTTLSLGTIKLAERNSIVKNLKAVETLGCTTYICSDKTGTLTRNEMTVKKIYTRKRLYDVTGSGYAPQGEIQKHGITVEAPKDALRMTIKVGAMCNTAKLLQNEEGYWEVAGDPTEGALLTLAEKSYFSLKELKEKEPQVWEYPFDSKRKLMSTAHETGGKVMFYTKGAPERLVERCAKFHDRTGLVDTTEKHRELLRKVVTGLSKQALRCLGMAYKELPAGTDFSSKDPDEWEQDLVWAGLVAMMDPPRDEAKDAIKLCKKAGIKVKMITGDYEVTASAIAQELGMIEPGEPYLTGTQIDGATDEELREVKVFARASPENKIRIVNALQKVNEVVAMTGDGVNDAPALKQADVGVGMGITGTDVSKEAADIVLADDNFATIVAAVEEGRAIYANMKKFIQFLISSNVGEILIIFVGLLLFDHAPLLATQILWINLVTDGFPAIALGFEPPDPDIMERPPRDPERPLVDKPMWKNILLVGITMMVATLGAFALTYSINIQNLESILSSDPNAFDAYLKAGQTAQDFVVEVATHRATAVAFTACVILQMLNVLNCRTEGSVFKINNLRNPLLMFAVLLSTGLQFMVIYTPGLNGVFHVAPLLDRPVLVWGDWLVIFLFSLSLLVAVEVQKMRSNRKGAR